MSGVLISISKSISFFTFFLKEEKTEEKTTPPALSNDFESNKAIFFGLIIESSIYSNNWNIFQIFIYFSISLFIPL